MKSQVNKISVHQINSNKSLNQDLEKIVDQFGKFSKLGELGQSPIDRLQNEKIDFKLLNSDIENSNTDIAKRFKELVPGIIPQLNPGPGSFASTNTLSPKINLPFVIFFKKKILFFFKLFF